MFWLQKRVLVVPINTLTGEVILLCWLEQLLSSHIFIWWWCVGVVSSSQWWRRDNWLCWLQLSHNSLGHAAINQKVSLIELGQRLSCIICICPIKNIDVGTLLNTLFPAKLHIHLIIKFQRVRCHSVEGCRPCDIKISDKNLPLIICTVISAWWFMWCMWCQNVSSWQTTSTV